MSSDTTLIVGLDLHQRTNVELMMDGHGDALDTIPGIGPVLAAGTIAEIGDQTREYKEQRRTA